MEKYNLNYPNAYHELKSSHFGNDFKFGVATAAYQVEGAYMDDGKGLSIWDDFVRKKGKIKNGGQGNIACDFYYRYPQDLQLMHQMGIKNFRFSIAWPRIFPEGFGAINPKGIEFYQRLIDECLKWEITPWITLYHWDLPKRLEELGGWSDRMIINRFGEYVDYVTGKLQNVPHWMIFNEPTSFISLGYLLGIHAPGKRGIFNFLKASHHANLAMALGGRIAKANQPNSEVGTTFFMVDVHPYGNTIQHQKAAERFDTIVNRLYIEPSLGLGYPKDSLPILERMEKYMLPDDPKNIQHKFDFIGLQNYTREIIRHNIIIPIIWAKPVFAQKRKVEKITTMNWEVYPEGIYHTLHRLAAYKGIDKIYITENGASFDDQPIYAGADAIDDIVNDVDRIDYLQSYLVQVLRAKQEGIPVKGYFVWSFMDNFEWAEGFTKRFGLVYVDYPSQRRIVKESGKWFSRFLRE